MDHSSGQWPPHEAESSGDLNSLIYQSEMTNSLHQIMESLAQELKNPPPPSPNYATAVAASSFPFEQPSSSSPSAEFNSSFMDISFGKHIAAAREETLIPPPPPLPRSAVELPQASSSSIFSFGNKDSSLDPAAQLFIGAVEAHHEINSNSTAGGLFSPTWSETTTKTLSFQMPAEKKSGGSRPPSGAQDHVIAERRRRERLNQQFIALSTIIPGLKKTDKASLLGDAINHIRQLEEKVKNLEDKASEKTVESTILVKKSHHHASMISDDSDDQEMMISTDDPAATGSSSSEGSRSSSMTLIPKITASLNGSSILVRIQCEKKKGLFVKVLSQIEKHHLSVINTSCMPFASSSLNITVTAQIEEGFSMTMKDLVKDLDSALSHF